MTSTGSGALPRLTSLRSFAALAVFLAHADAHDVLPLPGEPLALGYTGVAFFFVLSGFVLAWGTSPDTGTRTFYRRRLARIWPSHVLLLLVAALVPVVAVHRGWDAVGASLLLVQSWSPSDDIAYGMNGVAWSLSCEAFFYLVFPLTVWWARRSAPWTWWAGAAVALGFGAVAALVAGDYAYHSPPARLGEFLLGVAAGLSYRRGLRLRVPVWGCLLAVGGGLALSAVLPYPLPNTVMAAASVLVITAMASRDTATRRGWLTDRRLVLAGEVSFAFYLVHELVILDLAPALHLSAWIAAPLVLVVSAAVALAVHMWVERPANDLLRGRGRRTGSPRRQAASAESAPDEPSVVTDETHGGTPVPTAAP